MEAQLKEALQSATDWQKRYLAALPGASVVSSVASEVASKIWVAFGGRVTQVTVPPECRCIDDLVGLELSCYSRQLMFFLFAFFMFMNKMDAVDARFHAKRNSIPKDYDLLATDGTTVLSPGLAFTSNTDLVALGGGFAAEYPLIVRLVD